ncbi:PepSY-associated TM helix domain-containing protein [[Pseudomonas] carboxydohydrogena]
MILFAFTGITLNNAGKIEAKPSVVMRESQLPQALLAELKTAPHIAKAALPSNVSAWLYQEIGVNTADRETEWSAREIYIALPRPGGDAWLSIERDSGAISYELTNRGWIAYLNDLHKGRNAGKAWSWFIDLFATAAIIFCLTGLLLLQLHAKRRPATWPVVSLGLIIPTLLAVLLIHR